MTRHERIAAALVIGAASLAAVAGGQANPAGAVIEGQVLDAGSREPVAGAAVAIGAGTKPVQSDESGRFSLTGVPPGRYLVGASAKGYLPGAYGQRFPGDSEALFEVVEGQAPTRVRLLLWKTATIAGVVKDEADEPVVSVPVFALRETLTPRSSAFQIAQSVTTDDRGAYRITNLEPGQYVVAVPSASVKPDVLSAVRPGRTDTYPTLYYPDAASASAAVVLPLESGGTRDGVDFREMPGVGAVSVTGTVIDAPDRCRVQLFPPNDAAVTDLDVRSAWADADGHFAFSDVPAGAYMVRVTAFAPASGVPGSRVVAAGGTIIRGSPRDPVPPLPEAPTEWAELPITVTGTERAPVDLLVPLRTGQPIRGTVVFDGTTPAPSADTLLSTGVTPRPAGGREMVGFLPGRVETNLQFTTVGLPVGKYLLTFSPMFKGWFIRSVLASGRECRDEGIDVGGTGPAQASSRSPTKRLGSRALSATPAGRRSRSKRPCTCSRRIARCGRGTTCTGASSAKPGHSGAGPLSSTASRPESTSSRRPSWPPLKLGERPTDWTGSRRCPCACGSTKATGSRRPSGCTGSSSRRGTPARPSRGFGPSAALAAIALPRGAVVIEDTGHVI